MRSIDNFQALVEANRCLFCYDPPCTKACPAGIDIPKFIKKIVTGNLKGSAEVILKANILGGSCARVCPVKNLCEGACVLNNNGVKPIEIGKLQQYATDWAYSRGIKYVQVGKENGKKVALIGGGPASLSCAAELRKMGYSVVIYEKKEKPGGLNSYGIASYKMDFETAVKEAMEIEKIGVTFNFNVEVGKDVSFEELEQKFDAIFLGVGLGEIPKMNIPGEELSGVWNALSFIEKVKVFPNTLGKIGNNVVVIGGGNTAIDVARQAKLLGADMVTVVYRRDMPQMPAYKEEYKSAVMEGVHFQFLTLPVKILGNVKVEQIECIRMKLGDIDSSGRKSVTPIEGSNFIIDTDMVIHAVGQEVRFELLKKIKGLNLDSSGKVIVNPLTGQTTNPKYFAGGDCVNGGKEVVCAVGEGKIAAYGIHKYLQGEESK